MPSDRSARDGGGMADTAAVSPLTSPEIQMFEAARKFFNGQALPEDVVVPEMEDWHRKYRRTPDLWYLNQHARQLVFIADDFKRGHRRHELIDGQEPIHPSCYTLENFTCYKKDLGVHSFPLPFEKHVDFQIHGWYKPELARIRGELYALPSPYLWKVLDIEKENGLQFIRTRVSITVPWAEIKYSVGPDANWVEKSPVISRDYFVTKRAWMYIARPEYWDDYIGVALGTRGLPLSEHETPKDWIKNFYNF